MKNFLKSKKFSKLKLLSLFDQLLLLLILLQDLLLITFAIRSQGGFLKSIKNLFIF